MYKKIENIKKKIMQFTSYSCVFSGKIIEIHISINEKLFRKIQGFFNISVYIPGQNRARIQGIKP